MANTSLYFLPWTGSVNFAKFDIVWGINTGDMNYYYSTQDNNTGYHPSGRFVYSTTFASRERDVAFVSFAQTGIGPFFYPGSLVRITGMSDPSYNYTGMLLNGGSGFMKYVNPGYDQSQTPMAGGVQTITSPAWTTGFFFLPSYSTTVETEQEVITAQFEPGYSQRQPSSINNNVDTWNMVFNDRSDKETRAIRHYVQSKGGTYAFDILIPVSALDNQPNQKFVATMPKVQTKSWNINDSQITVKRVFDL